MKFDFISSRQPASQKDLVSLAHVHLEARVALGAVLPFYKGFFGLHASIHKASKARSEIAGGRVKDPLQGGNCPNLPWHGEIRCALGSDLRISLQPWCKTVTGAQTKGKSVVVGWLWRGGALWGEETLSLALLLLPSASPSAAHVDVRVQLSQAPGKGIISTTHKKIEGFGICFEVLAARLSKEA